MTATNNHIILLVGGPLDGAPNTKRSDWADALGRYLRQSGSSVNAMRDSS